MTKTFCDRCGKEITEECKYGLITHRTLYASIRFIPWKKHTEWSERVERCICPECEDSYIHWFMNPKTDACNSCNRRVGCKDGTDLTTRNCGMKTLR